jgi:hypothetical protein
MSMLLVAERPRMGQRAGQAELPPEAVDVLGQRRAARWLREAARPGRRVVVDPEVGVARLERRVGKAWAPIEGVLW